VECPSCGHSSADAAARFCSNCGTELTDLVEPLDPIAAIDSAVDAFEAGELQEALDALDEQLDRAEEANDEVTLIYLLDVTGQMVGQLEEGEFENIEQLLADVRSALQSLQAKTLPPALEQARERFAEGDHPAALELLHDAIADAPTPDEEAARLTVWRVFALSADMVWALDNQRVLFEQTHALAAQRLATNGELLDLEANQPDQFDSLDGEADDAEQESMLEPFETSNPWLQKLFAMPSYGRVPVTAINLLREVSPDEEERLLTAMKVHHGALRSGYLLATTKYLRWIQTFPTRQEDVWGYDHKLEYKGIGLGLTRGVIILASGDQFQTWRARGKPFAQMYSIILQAVVWEASNADQTVVAAISRPPQSPSASIADELRKLSEMRDHGILTSEEFAAAKQKLVET
jgi:Short C-terminal domain